jgi:hypothetical protein
MPSRCVAWSAASQTSEGYIAATNLSRGAVRTSVHEDPENEARGYAAEQARWEREERQREMLDEAAGPLLDGPCYGSGGRFSLVGGSTSTTAPQRDRRGKAPPH